MENIQVYIINLDRATDRWNKWKDINMGFDTNNIHRFSAIDGKKMSNNEMRQYVTPLTYLKILGNVKRSPEDIDNKSALCCSLSHFGVFNDFFKNHPDSKYLLVFEDDTSLSDNDKKNLYTKISNSLKELPSDDWDIWLLGYLLLRDSKDWKNPDPTPYSSSLIKNPLNIKNSSARFSDVRSYWGTNAYIIKRDSIPKIQKYNFPIETHIDLYYSVLAQIGEIRIIHDKNIILTQESMFGNIPHTFFSIALLNQEDVIYKVIVICIVILILILLYIYVVKGCFGYNFFNFLGNKLSCKI